MEIWMFEASILMGIVGTCFDFYAFKLYLAFLTRRRNKKYDWRGTFKTWTRQRRLRRRGVSSRSAEGESVSGPSSSSWSSSFTHRLCAASLCRWRSGHTGRRARRQAGRQGKGKGKGKGRGLCCRCCRRCCRCCRPGQGLCRKPAAAELHTLNLFLSNSIRQKGKKEKNTNLKKNNRLNQENNLVTLGWKSLTRNVCRSDCSAKKQVHRFGPF